MMSIARIEQTEPHEPGELMLPRSASQQVLIVEDEKRLREMLCSSVIEMGMLPTAAASAEAALRLVGQQFFAVAVLDLNLPGMGGLELCERLHQHKPHMQVVILTGFGDLETARQAIRLEVVDFLTKPCGMDELENALNRARLRWLDRWGIEIASQAAQPFAVKSAASPSTAVVAGDSHTPASMDDMERELILQALTRHGGNRQAAATELGISVRKLYYRLQIYQQQGFLKEE